MPAIAGDCIAAIRARQPAGPYRLLGFSLGGLVALEIAHQLAAAGEAIGFLGLLDAPVRFDASDRRVYRESLILVALRWRRIQRIWKHHHDGHERLHRTAWHLRRIAWIVRERCAWWVTRLPGYAEKYRWRLMDRLGLSAWFRPRDINEAHRFAFVNYHPEHYSGEATLFVAKDQKRPWYSLEAAWRPLIENLNVVKIPGSHHTIMRPPGVSGLANAIDTRLARLWPSKAEGES